MRVLGVITSTDVTSHWSAYPRVCRFCGLLSWHDECQHPSKGQTL